MFFGHDISSYLTHSLQVLFFFLEKTGYKNLSMCLPIINNKTKKIKKLKNKYK
jgi:hypothetical protein